MYTRAANMFKIAKNWSAAGNAFCQAAKLHMQLQSKHDSATSFVDAGNAYKKADPQEAINCLNAAIDIYTDMGRFTIAAKHHITIAEIYEAELVDIEKAIAHYEQAADYYKGEESNSSANKCLLKVAAYAAQLEQYQKAIEIYEQVGTNTMDNPLLKYSAKEYFFKAALCHFIVDELNAKLALEKYEEMFPAFTDSRECKLLKVSKASIKIRVSLANTYGALLCAFLPCRRFGHLFECFRGHQTCFALYQACGSGCSRKMTILADLKKPPNCLCVHSGWFE
uniref:NSF attachment protein beta n=1 Tax=Otus sunia TaxID=257818 RepID=A0A8C8AL64_9STRI